MIPDGLRQYMTVVVVDGRRLLLNMVMKYFLICFVLIILTTPHRYHYWEAHTIILRSTNFFG